MVIEYISETSVRLKVENENNKITNKLKTIFMGGKTPPLNKRRNFMLKNLANEINNLLLDNEGKAQEILNLNSNISSLNATIEVLQNENQSLLDMKVELTSRILELEEQIVNVEANKELENIIVELNNQILSLNAEKEVLSQTVADLQAQLENSEIEANLKLEEVKTIVEELKELVANA